jgi:hypothetical protein
LRDEDFSWSLDVIDVRISKLQFLIKKMKTKFSAVKILYKFLVMKPLHLDPDSDLDPAPDLNPQ